MGKAPGRRGGGCHGREGAGRGTAVSHPLPNTSTPLPPHQEVPHWQELGAPRFCLARTCRLTFCDGGDGRKGRPKGRFHSGLEREHARLGTDPRRGWGHALTPMCPRARVRTQGHTTDTHGTALLRASRWGGGCSGRSAGGPTPTAPSYRGCGVWGGKGGRPPGEAAVAGVLARAHALESHLGSSGRVSCGGSARDGFRDGVPGP